MVPPGTVTDTTGDGGWVPVTVTAVLAEPVIGIGAHPAHIDGPAAWSAFLSWTDGHGRRSLPDPSGPVPPADFALPMATWTAPAPPGTHPSALAADPAAVWGWACSRALYDPAGHLTVQVRKHPETGPAARYARDSKWDIGSGPLKARDTPHAAVLAREIRWHALADPPALLALLRRVRHLGALGGHGNGAVLRWETVKHQDRDAWRDRVFPLAGGAPGGIRAPYWHPSRQVQCTR